MIKPPDAADSPPLTMSGVGFVLLDEISISEHRANVAMMISLLANAVAMRSALFAGLAIAKTSQIIGSL